MSVSVEGLNETLSYFRGLESRVDRAQAKSISSNAALNDLKTTARDIMKTVSYDQFPNAEEKSLDAIDATLDNESPLFVSVGIPFNSGLLTISGPNKGANVYSIFRLPEFFEASFLRPAYDFEPTDFLTAWQDEFSKSVPEALSLALDEEFSR